jgi:hypothetical protein
MNVDYAYLVTAGVALTDAALHRLLPGTETLPHSIHRAMRCLPEASVCVRCSRWSRHA